MAKSVKKEPVGKNKTIDSKNIKSWEVTKQQKFVIGSLLVLFSVALLVALFLLYSWSGRSRFSL
jgi:S-DNA-T family DNA segregation ATPase FtsK/SpoIIIE